MRNKRFVKHSWLRDAPFSTTTASTHSHQRRFWMGGGRVTCVRFLRDGYARVLSTALRLGCEKYLILEIWKYENRINDPFIDFFVRVRYTSTRTHTHPPTPTHTHTHTHTLLTTHRKRCYLDGY